MSSRRTRDPRTLDPTQDPYGFGSILWRWGRLLPIINVFHFYYLLWGEASEGVSGGEAGREEKGEKVEKALGERESKKPPRFLVFGEVRTPSDTLVLGCNFRK